MLVKLLALCASLFSVNANVASDAPHPNVIIMHVNKLGWGDLGIHVNRRDSENSTPNIDYLAYSGIILNRFYANGGLDALLSGCYQRSKYANTNLMTFYFERNGYDVNFIARNSADKVEVFEEAVLNTISNDNRPFFTVVDFGDIKIPFIDEIVAAVVMKAHKVNVMQNTIILFLSLPDNNGSPLEINIRRTAFVYSPLLKLQQRVSNQIVHVIDWLPTLVNASSLKWRTRDRIFMDGINQWPALNTNDEERLDVYGDNFYISNYWKLAYGANDSANSYGSIENENMESDKDINEYDFETYAKSILASEVSPYLHKLDVKKIMFLKSRARVHCNLKDVAVDDVKNILCSSTEPCLFNLLEDPCEFDNKFEHEFDLRRNHMQTTLRRYLNGEREHEKSASSAAGSSMEDGTIVGVILGGSIAIAIFIFVIVVCIKERCNRRRSVYHDKSKKKKTGDEEHKTTEENSSEPNGDVNAISVISKNVK